MALINCPECGKEISDKAKSCPNCGAKVKKTGIIAVMCIIVMIVVVVIAGIYFVVNRNRTNHKNQVSNQEKVNDIEKDTEKEIIKEQESKYERYVNIAIKNTQEQLKHPDSISLNKVIVCYTIEDDILVSVNVAIDFSSENDIGTSPRNYSVSGAYPAAVDDQNYMNTSVYDGDKYYSHYYRAVTEKGFLKDVFKQKADEYYEGTVNGQICGYFNYNIEDITN